MYKQILATVSGTEGDEAVYQMALLAARPFAGHMSFLHVRPDVREAMVSMTAGGGGLGGQALQELADHLEEEAARHASKAEASFKSFCAATGVVTGPARHGSGLSAELVVETGKEELWLAAYGRSADLVVVGRVRDDQDAAIDLLEAALMDTGKPLLIAPPTAPQSLRGTVVIAWKDTVEAARAIAMAMPLIDRAERLVILCVGENDPATMKNAQQLQAALHRHVAATSLEMIGAGNRPPAETLLDAARRLGATLLVMGGYSHSRLREVVFGGFTKHVLHAADIPVLMAH